MTDRNLPPGCSSADGGIDHALEASLEDLCDDVTDAGEADALRKLLPAVRELLQGARDEGRFEAQFDEQAAAPALELLRDYVAERAQKSQLRIYRPTGLATTTACEPTTCELEYACAFVDELLRDRECLAHLAAYARMRIPVPKELVRELLPADAARLVALILQRQGGNVFFAAAELEELDPDKQVVIERYPEGGMQLKLEARS